MLFQGAAKASREDRDPVGSGQSKMSQTLDHVNGRSLLEYLIFHVVQIILLSNYKH